MSDIDDCRKSVERLTRDRGEVMRAGDDKIAEIRARRAATEVYQQSLTDRVQMHDDRATLLAERIAQARWRYFTWIRGPHFGDPSWMDLSQDARDTLLNESRQILSALKAAGLAVVESEDGR